MRRLALIAALAGAVAAAGVSGTAYAAIRSCGSRTVGGTGVVTAAHGGGATCLLTAFAACTPASYELSSFGVDTIARSTFTVTKGTGGCYLAVGRSFEVVPQKSRPAGSGRCAAVARRASDIVATGCHGGGLTASVSLTGKR